MPGTSLGTKDPGANKSRALKGGHHCLTGAPAALPRVLAAKLRSAIPPAERDPHFRPFFLQTDTPALPQPLTWGRHRSPAISARINYRPIIFMHKTWHRRPEPGSPAQQLPSGQSGVKGKGKKASYKIKEVNGSLGYKKRRGLKKKFFFCTSGLDFLYRCEHFCSPAMRRC